MANNKTLFPPYSNNKTTLVPADLITLLFALSREALASLSHTTGRTCFDIRNKVEPCSTAVTAVSLFILFVLFILITQILVGAILYDVSGLYTQVYRSVW
jgi:uncharacterized membrane protein